nr:HAD-IA family hydrolase [Paenibacillus glacialis]
MPQEIMNLLKELTLLHIKMVIITNKSRKCLDICLKNLGITDFFITTIAGDEVTQPKPDPEGIYKAIQMMNLRSDEVVFVGDSNADITAGKSANILTVGAHWFGTVQNTEFSIEPDHIFTRTEELKSFINICIYPCEKGWIDIPFTFAHPLYAAPLKLLKPKYVSLTGIILGSMAPDFEYFMALEPYQIMGHTTKGLFIQAIPLSLLLAYIFHRLIKVPLTHNLPPLFNMDKKSNGIIQDWNLSTVRSWIIFIVSVMIGFYSHVLLDGFTHKSGYVSRFFL